MSSQFTLQLIQVRLYNITFQLSTRRSELEAIPSESFLFGWWKLLPVSCSRVSVLKHVFQWLTAIFFTSAMYSSFILVFCSHLLLFRAFLRTDLFTNTAANFDQCIKYLLWDVQGANTQQLSPWTSHNSYLKQWFKMAAVRVKRTVELCLSYWTLFIIAKCLKKFRHSSRQTPQLPNQFQVPLKAENQ